MDVLIRGLCEQYIDNKLEESEVRGVRDLIDSIDLPVTTEDVLLGYFLGSASSQLRNFYMAVYNRVPEKEEAERFQELLVRRAPEIIAKIISLSPVGTEGSSIDAPADGEDEMMEGLHPIVFEEPKGSEAEEAVVSEIELSPVATIDNSGGSKESMKFSFQARSVKKPITTVLGVPIKK